MHARSVFTTQHPKDYLMTVIEPVIFDGGAIDHDTYFTCLPRDYYFSEEIYELEKERIFDKQWMYFCHVSELENPGDYVAREFFDENVIVSRGKDGSINAVLNVCRHRGSLLCEPGSGNASKFVCPYHRWAYAPDGNLISAPTIRDGDNVDYKDWGLKKVQLDVWQGFVFICLGREKLRPVAEIFADVDAEISRIQPERMKIVKEITYEFEANWKVVMENFAECYHCAGQHPELAVIIDPNTLIFADEDHGGWAHGAIQYGAVNQGLSDDAQSLTRDGEYASKKLLGEFGDGAEVPHQFSTGFMIQPTVSQYLTFADHGSLIEIRPVGVDKTLFIDRWFVHEDAVEGEDYDVENVYILWDITNRQDQAICKSVQKGMRSRDYEPGPLSSKREPGVRSAMMAYLELMRG